MRRLVRVAASLSFGLAVTIALPSVAESAPHNRLTLGSVSPSSGTTSTTFVFSVTFNGVGGTTASGVVAKVAGLTVALALAPSTKGTWRGSSGLPAGSWPVRFEAIATGTTPPLDLPQPVVVTAPGPTPRPTALPTAVPAATTTPTLKVDPTPVPIPGSSDAPASNPPPFGTTFEDPSHPGSPPVAAASASPDIATLPAPSRAGLPVEGIAAIGLLAVVAVAAVSAERRRRRIAAGETDDSVLSESPPVPHDEDHLATIDYVPPDESIDEPTREPGG